MKKITFLVLAILWTTLTFAQKKEKVKGTKLVTVEKSDIGAFDQIEIEDNVDVFLIKGDKNAIEVEADDNLHATINKQVYGTTLRINTNKEVSSFKKFEVRITYTDSLKLVSVKHEAKLNSIQELKLPNITIKTYDYSKSFLNVNSPNFAIISTDKSKVELNLKGGDDASIEMNKNAEIKALISSNKVKLDMYQKSEANIEGDASDMKVRLDNNSKFIGKNLTAKSIILTAEGYSNAQVKAKDNLSLAASGKAEVAIFGDPKIEIKKFADDATLYKKSK
ncbi:GIN domain-containing protein [Flavobacterium sp. GCM10027622]|uniref:GIN domain-containing protein n=1 Tax=unclassified Flavobacterium TaxID=196869 RepID=UPI00360C63F2